MLPYSKALSIIIAVLVGMFCGGASNIALMESIRLAQCRASCMEKMPIRSPSQNSALNPCQDNCEMCWNTCRLLQGDSPAGSSLCADRSACFPGCQTACKFYQNTSHRNSHHLFTVTPDFLDNLPALLGAAFLQDNTVKWDPPRWRQPSLSRPVVYILMRKDGHCWEEVLQTMQQSAVLPAPVVEEQEKLNLLAVTSIGIASYTNVTRGILATTASSLVVVLGSSGRHYDSYKDTLMDGSGDPQYFAGAKNDGSGDDSYNTYTEFGDSEPPLVTVDHSWRVDLIPLRIDLLANVRVIWEVRGSGYDDYLISWMEKFGVVSGHLVAKETQVEISLWAGQEYVVRVELLDKHGNAVLRSGSKPISFGTKSEGALSSTNVSHNTRRPTVNVRTTQPPARFTPPRGFAISNRVKEHFGIRGDRVFFPKEESLTKMFAPHLVEERNKMKSLTPYHPYRDSVRSAPIIRNDKRNLSESAVTRINSDLKHSTGLERADGASEESHDSLVIWAVCLGAGAVILLILIPLAIRTLQKTVRSTRNQRRNEDYQLSETTASSVNSVSTSNNLTQSTTREDLPYETFYAATDQQLRPFAYHRHDLHRHSSIVPHPTQPPSTPVISPIIIPHHTHSFHQNCVHSPMRSPVQSIAPSPSNSVNISTNSADIGNGILMENYILSLDPAPTYRRGPNS